MNIKVIKANYLDTKHEKEIQELLNKIEEIAISKGVVKLP